MLSTISYNSLLFHASLPDQLETISGLQALGFQGFRTITELRSGTLDTVPQGPGVYLVMRTAATPRDFLAIGIGGHFKRRDPNVPITRLASEWVDGALVVYVGQAGTRSIGTPPTADDQRKERGRGASPFSSFASPFVCLLLHTPNEIRNEVSPYWVRG